MDPMIAVNVDVAGRNGVPSIVQIPNDITWPDFELLLKLTFEYSEGRVTYVDEDYDKVTISNQDDLFEAFKVALRQGNTLHVKVTPIDTSQASAPPVEIVFEDLKPDKMETFETSSDSTDSDSSTSSKETPIVSGETGEPCIEAACSTSNQTPPPRPKCETGTDAAMATCCESGENSLVSSPHPPNWVNQFQNDMARSIADSVTKQILNGLEGAVITSVYQQQSSDQGAVPKQIMYTHDGVVCDICERCVVGVRYKCGNCKDFDLCEECEATDHGHDPEHVFLKIRRPVLKAGRKRNGRMVSLLKKNIYKWNEDEDSSPEEDKYLEKMKRREERIRMKEAKYEEKMRQKEEKRLKRREDKLKRRSVESEKQSPSKKEKLDIPQLGFSAFYEAEFICDETFPDGVKVQPSTKLTKKWCIKNTGNSVWNEDTKLVHLWGTMKYVQDTVPVPALEPMSSGVVKVELIVPDTPGYYQSHWRLCHKGYRFGHRVWCSVIVEPKAVLDLNTPSNLEVTEKKESKETEEVTNKLTPQDLISFEMLEIGNADRNTPKVSQTATPTNTPCAISPPKSPVRELELHISQSSSVEVISNPSPESNVPNMTELVQERMASLGLKPDLEVDDFESLSNYSDDSNDSDDFYIVPMPACFDLNQPTGAAQAETRAETKVDSQEETPVETQLSNDSVDTVTEQVADTKDTDVYILWKQASDLGDQDLRKEQKQVQEEELAQAPQSPVQSQPIPTPDLPRPIGSSEVSPGSSPHDVAAHVLKAAGQYAATAAVTAYSTAKDVIQGFNEYVPPQSQWKPKPAWQPAPQMWAPPPRGQVWTDNQSRVPQQTEGEKQSNMDKLIQMGFANRQENERLLKLHNDDLSKVIEDLIQGNTGLHR